MAIKEFKTVKDLQSTHEKYNKCIDDWRFYELAYDGGKEFIEAVLFKNERETGTNYRNRIEEAYNFNFPGSIVDLFNFYLTEKKATRVFKPMKKDKQWAMFLKDANLKGIDYNLFLDECQKLASVSGATGILVDKPAIEFKTVEDEIRHRAYPYVCAYTMSNILDWEFDINKNNGRYELSFLKLKMDEGLYYVWTKSRWIKYKIVRANVVDIDSQGVNPIGVIPFLWMSNIQTVHGPLKSKSDIRDIGKICGSLVRNFSSGEEIIKYAGFPIYRKPMEIDDGMDEEEDGEGIKIIGRTDVEEFDPEHGDAGKPDWMKTEIAEPIEAILRWTDRKVDEIYRVCHLSGVHGQRKSNNEVASGLALKYEFQQLTSVMNKKSDSMTEADYGVIYFWLLWQGKVKHFDDLEITRPKNFSIDELAASLDNIITAMSNVMSETFRQEAQKKIVKQELPNAAQSSIDKIHKEIENTQWVDPNLPQVNSDAGDQANNDGDIQ